MAGKVKISMDTKGIDETIALFDKLNKKEQEFVVKGSAVGRKLDEIGKKGKKAFTEINTAAKKKTTSVDRASSAVKGLIVSWAGMQGVRKIIELLNNEMNKNLENLKKIASEARKIRMEILNAEGNLLANNPGIDTNRITKRMKLIVKEEGAIGANAIAKLNTDFRKVNAGTQFTGITEEDRFNALHMIYRQALMDPTTDVAGQTKIMLKMLAEARRTDKTATLTEMNNSFTTAAIQAEVSKSEFGVPVAKAMAATEKGFTMNQVLGILARLSDVAEDPTGDKTATALIRIADKLLKAPNRFRAGKEAYAFKASPEESGKRFTELLDVLNKLPTKLSKTKALEKLDILRPSDQAAILTLSKDPEAFKKFMGTIDKARKGPNLAAADSATFYKKPQAQLNKAEQIANAKTQIASAEESDESLAGTLMELGKAKLKITGARDNRIIKMFDSNSPEGILATEADRIAYAPGSLEEKLAEFESFSTRLAFTNALEKSVTGDGDLLTLGTFGKSMKGASPEIMARVALRSGLVNPVDGTQKVEREIYSNVGLSDDWIAELTSMKNSGASEKELYDYMYKGMESKGIKKTHLFGNGKRRKFGGMGATEDWARMRKEEETTVNTPDDIIRMNQALDAMGTPQSMNANRNRVNDRANAALDSMGTTETMNANRNLFEGITGAIKEGIESAAKEQAVIKERD